jgi:hypothetical protein
MKLFFLVCAFLLMSRTVFAEHVDPDLMPHWQARCSVQGQVFTLHFDSKAGSVDGDDMSVTAYFDSSQIAIPLPPNWYHSLGKKITNSACDGVLGKAVSDGKILLLVLTDNRPSPPGLSGVVLDLKAKKVVSVNNDVVGLFYDTSKVETVSDGFRLYLYQGSQKDHRAGHDSRDVLGWTRITAHAGLISQQWEKPMPEAIFESAEVCKTRCEKMKQDNQLKPGIDLEKCLERTCAGYKNK